MKLVLSLKDASDLALAGGKAVSLSRLLGGGFRTADGFVITTSAFNSMNKSLKESILEAFDNLGSDYAAVRSSAVAEDGKNAAWAGQLDTFLNVSKSEVIKYIKKCWESANSARALAYAEQKGLEVGPIAVIVQAMVPSEVSGIAFSINPVTNNENQIIIEAGLGLNEPIVSGEITPDTYVIDKATGSVLQSHIASQTKKLVQGKNGRNEWRKVAKGDKQKLTKAQIKEVLDQVKKLEKFFGFYVDAEWTYADGKLFILQCRPITNLG